MDLIYSDLEDQRKSKSACDLRIHSWPADCSWQESTKTYAFMNPSKSINRTSMNGTFMNKRTTLQPSKTEKENGPERFPFKNFNFEISP